eukprot:gb/GECG01012378.1/.p1 GENE.gb/GECG01012378.1/~~gb/GECG01012378.1/.p1  ORF type:complete len:266 (+),score=14.38 gb/GECG01012378.1/:1-798(+)
MGTRLSKAVEYASAHEAHEYQVALGLITIPLQLISKSGTKLEHQKDEHVTLTSKMVRSVVFAIPHVWMAWTMKTNRIRPHMASCYIGYLTYLTCMIGNHISMWWQPYLLDNCSTSRKRVVNGRGNDCICVVPQIRDHIRPPLHTTVTLPLSSLALWRATVSLQERIASAGSLHVTLRDKIVFSIAAAGAVLYPLSIYFESYVYPSPWQQQRAVSHSQRTLKNEPEVQRESSYLVTSLLSVCYMTYLGFELFGERMHSDTKEAKSK